MTAKDLIKSALKDLKIDRRTKAGREAKRQEQAALVKLNKILDHWKS